MLSVYYGGVEYSVRVSRRANASVYFDLMGEQSLLLPAMRAQNRGIVRLAPRIDRNLLHSLQSAELIGRWRQGPNVVEAELGPELSRFVR